MIRKHYKVILLSTVAFMTTISSSYAAQQSPSEALRGVAGGVMDLAGAGARAFRDAVSSVEKPIVEKGSVVLTESFSGIGQMLGVGVKLVAKTLPRFLLRTNVGRACLALSFLTIPWDYKRWSKRNADFWETNGFLYTSPLLTQLGNNTDADWTQNNKLRKASAFAGAVVRHAPGGIIGDFLLGPWRKVLELPKWWKENTRGKDRPPVTIIRRINMNDGRLAETVDDYR